MFRYALNSHACLDSGGRMARLAESRRAGSGRRRLAIRVHLAMGLVIYVGILRGGRCLQVALHFRVGNCLAVPSDRRGAPDGFFRGVGRNSGLYPYHALRSGRSNASIVGTRRGVGLPKSIP